MCIISIDCNRMTISDYSTKPIRGDRENCTGSLEIAHGQLLNMYSEGKP